jgi:hypothetical protein
LEQKVSFFVPFYRADATKIKNKYKKLNESTENLKSSMGNADLQQAIPKLSFQYNSRPIFPDNKKCGVLKINRSVPGNNMQSMLVLISISGQRQGKVKLCRPLFALKASSTFVPQCAISAQRLLHNALATFLESEIKTASSGSMHRINIGPKWKQSERKLLVIVQESERQ